MNEQANIVWAILFDTTIVGVYPTFDAARAACLAVNGKRK